MKRICYFNMSLSLKQGQFLLVRAGSWSNLKKGGCTMGEVLSLSVRR